MQSFWFFVPIPRALPSVAKELGERGLVPANIKKTSFLETQNFFFTFPHVEFIYKYN